MLPAKTRHYHARLGNNHSPDDVTSKESSIHYQYRAPNQRIIIKKSGSVAQFPSRVSRISLSIPQFPPLFLSFFLSFFFCPTRVPNFVKTMLGIQSTSSHNHVAVSKPHFLSLLNILEQLLRTQAAIIILRYLRLQLAQLRQLRRWRSHRLLLLHSRRRGSLIHHTRTIPTTAPSKPLEPAPALLASASASSYIRHETRRAVRPPDTRQVVPRGVVVGVVRVERLARQEFADAAGSPR